MNDFSFEPRTTKFFLQLKKLQGIAGFPQIKKIADNPNEEYVSSQKLKENSTETKLFFKKKSALKTHSYFAKKNKYMFTSRIDESGESYFLSEKEEKKLFQTMSLARNYILKFAFRSDEIYEFMYKISKKVDDGTLKITSVINYQKRSRSIENCRKSFLETMKKIQETIGKNYKINKKIEQKTVNLFFSLDINEKTKSAIYKKYTQTQDYKNEISDKFHKWEQIYSNSKKEIIEANIHMVFSIAKEYGVVHKGILDITDIIQEGNIGLIGAVDSFDVARGVRFSSYAVWFIRRQIWTVINSFKKMVYIPAKASADLYRISIFEEKYNMRNGKKPTVAEIAKKFNIKEKYVVSLLSFDLDDVNYNYESIMNDDDYYENFDAGGKDNFNPFSALESAELKENIKKLLDQIGSREKNIVKLYYGLIEKSEAMNLAQIGNLYGLSSERVRQIIEKTMENMQNIGKNGILKEWKKDE